MSERKNNSITVRAANGSVQRVVRRSILALATLSALVFVSAGPSRAQSQSAAPKSAPAVVGASAPSEAAATNAATLKQSTTPQPAAESTESARQSAPQAHHEGITVHGHWTIEVRNPDGSVADRREFENALAPLSGPNQLTQLLSGEWVPGGFVIQLVQTGATGACDNAGDCFLYDTRYGNPCPSIISTSIVCGTLTYTQNVSTTPFFANGYTLTGTIQPPSAIQIITVATGTILCIPNNALGASGPATVSQTSPQVCATANASTISPNVTTQQQLTTARLSSAVSVVAGQTVAVTVQISFQ